MTETEARAAEAWTSWLQNRISNEYPEAAEYTIEIEGNRARMLNASGDELGAWRADRYFIDGVMMTLDPRLRPNGTKAFFAEIWEATKKFFGAIMRLPWAALEHARR